MLSAVSARSTRSKRRALQHAEQNNRTSSAARVVSGKLSGGKRSSIQDGRALQKSILPSPTRLKQQGTARDAIKIWQDEEVNISPCTPSHRHSQSKTQKVFVTPRHRLMVGGVVHGGLSTTLRTPCRARTAVYSLARDVFSRSSNPGKLTGRDNERHELHRFIEQQLRLDGGGCLYVSGPPGTGKSALLNEVQDQFRETAGLKIGSVNCMSIRNADDFKAKIEMEFELFHTQSGSDIRTLFTRQCNTGLHSKYLLVLDEIDRLLEFDQDLLYAIFECSMARESRLILIGIANALDLTDRCLPKLKNRGLKPDLLPFMPYSAAQIANVLVSKLNALSNAEEPGPPPFFHPAAIQLCAKKVAAQSGDLRKAFDICRQAIDVVEKETIEKDATQDQSPTRTPLIENINLSSPLTPKSPDKSPDKPVAASQSYTVASAPRVSITHVAKITAQVFSNGASQRLASLNLQQKAVLCSLAALEQRKQASQLDRSMYDTPSKVDKSAPTVKQLCDAYTLLCKQGEMLQPLSTLEFCDIVSRLESQSLITCANGKAGSFANPLTPSRTPSRKLKAGFTGMTLGDERRITSGVGRRELEASVQGAGSELLRDILSGHC